MSAWILTATGKDRPGIVATVTKMLFDLGCNLDDSSMTRLADEFAIMVVFTAPAKLSAARLAKAGAAIGRKFKLAVFVKPLRSAARADHKPSNAHLISVYGADQPGIVYRVSEHLARRKVNIIDVSTHRTHPKSRGAKPLYLMLLEVELPGKPGADALEQELRLLAHQLGCEVSLRPSETEIL